MREEQLLADCGSDPLTLDGLEVCSRRLEPMGPDAFFAAYLDRDSSSLSRQ